MNAGTYSDSGGDACYGLVCENTVFKATDQKYAMKFTAEDGMAVVCDPGRESSQTPVGYEGETHCDYWSFAFSDR